MFLKGTPVTFVGPLPSFSYLFCCILQKARQHTTEQGGGEGGRITSTLHRTSTDPTLNMSLSEIYLLSHCLPKGKMERRERKKERTPLAFK